MDIGETAGTAASLLTGGAYDAVEAYSGEQGFTGRTLTDEERAYATAGVVFAGVPADELAKVARVFRYLVYGDEVVEVVGKGADDVLKHTEDFSKPVVVNVPTVKKAVNSKLPHAIDQSIEKGLATAGERAKLADELRGLTSSIGKSGFPEGAVPDPGKIIPRADSVLVPFRNGAAVYEVGKNGTVVR